MKRKEIENLNVMELNKIAKELGLSNTAIKNFTVNQKVAYVYSNLK